MSPSAPVVGVGGVVVHEGRVLLIRRGKQPLYGRWVVPGGTVELGEPLEEALVREMREETGLEVEPFELLTVFDRIERDGERVLYHYVIVDYLCRWRAGRGAGGLGCARGRRGHARRSSSGTTCRRRRWRWCRTRFAARAICNPHSPQGFPLPPGDEGRILSAGRSRPGSSRRL